MPCLFVPIAHFNFSQQNWSRIIRWHPPWIRNALSTNELVTMKCGYVCPLYGLFINRHTLLNKSEFNIKLAEAKITALNNKLFRVVTYIPNAKRDKKKKKRLIARINKWTNKKDNKAIKNAPSATKEVDEAEQKK